MHATVVHFVLDWDIIGVHANGEQLMEPMRLESMLLSRLLET